MFFVLFFITYLLFIHITFQSQPPSSSSPRPALTNTLTPLPTPVLREGEAPLWYHFTLGHRVPAGLSTSSPTKAQTGGPGRGRGSNGRQQNQRQPQFQLLRDTNEDKVGHLLQIWGHGARPSSYMLFG